MNNRRQIAGIAAVVEKNLSMKKKERIHGSISTSSDGSNWHIRDCGFGFSHHCRCYF
jgi:hypothetical protein